MFGFYQMSGFVFGSGSFLQLRKVESSVRVRFFADFQMNIYEKPHKNMLIILVT